MNESRLRLEVRKGARKSVERSRQASEQNREKAQAEKRAEGPKVGRGLRNPQHLFVFQARDPPSAGVFFSDERRQKRLSAANLLDQKLECIKWHGSGSAHKHREPRSPRASEKSRHAVQVGARMGKRSTSLKCV